MGQGTLGPVGQGALGPVGQGTLGPVGQGTLGPVGQGATFARKIDLRMEPRLPRMVFGHDLHHVAPF